MADETPSLRRRVLAHELVLGTFNLLASPGAAEIAARAGLDWVAIDLEHGETTEASLAAQLLAIRAAGAAALVRVEQGTRLRIGRVLDLGADGIVVPQVGSGQEAREVASAMRYPPTGKRGLALAVRGLDYGAGGHAAPADRHESLLGVVQVESATAVDAAPEMAAVEGIDVLFVGPTDLSHALGVPGRLEEPAFERAIGAVGRAARDAGKAAGVLIWTPRDAARYIDAGFTFLSISSDGPLLDRAVRGALAETRAIATERLAMAPAVSAGTQA